MISVAAFEIGYADGYMLGVFVDCGLSRIMLSKVKIAVLLLHHTALDCFIKKHNRLSLCRWSRCKGQDKKFLWEV